MRCRLPFQTRLEPNTPRERAAGSCPTRSVLGKVGVARSPRLSGIAWYRSNVRKLTVERAD